MATKIGMSGKTKRWTRSLALLLAFHMVLLSSPISSFSSTNLLQPAFAQAAADESDSKVRFTITPAGEPANASSTSSPNNSGAASKQPNPASLQQSKLDPKQVAALFDKLSKLPALDKASSKLILPEDSLIKPPLGETQSIAAFQPARQGESGPSRPLPNSASPLTVTRISHSGAVDDLKKLTITFSQPLIELSTLSQISAIDPNQFVTITPQPKGSWQWAGSQTLIFTPEGGHFPKATNYVVTVPAGAKSITGNQIDKSYSYQISLPPAKIAEFYPPETARENQSPLLVAHFNQNIDQEKVLAKTHIFVGKRSYGIKTVSRKDYKSRLESMRKARQTGEKLPENGQSWLATASILQLPHETDQDFVAFEPAEPLPKNSTIKVVFDKNIPSEEGPLASETGEERSFKTYGPLVLFTKSIAFATTTMANSLSRVDSSVQSQKFEFNNPIDSAKFKPTMVTISPPVEKFEVQTPRSQSRNYNFSLAQTPENSISIDGHFKPFTRYTVAFNEKITDIFGQPLGKQATAHLQTQGLIPAISPYQGFKTLDPSEPLIHSIWAQGSKKLEVAIRKVEAEDWDKFNRDSRSANLTVGTLVETKEYYLGPLGRKINLDLKPYIDGRYGHLILSYTLVNPSDRQAQHNCWIQVTDLSLDAFTRGKVHVLASNLSDGKPVEGVELSLGGTAEKTKSDASGRASLPLSESAHMWVPLVGRKGADSSVVTIINSNMLGRSNLSPKLVQYAVSDRKLYKPGERVYIKGILRERKYPDSGAIDLSLPPVKALTYELQQDYNKQILRGECLVDDQGSFAFDFLLPTRMKLGKLELYTFSKGDRRATIEEGAQPIDINVQEFRRPEFETSVSSSKGNSMFLGDETVITSRNHYFSGGALANTDNQWVVKARAHSFDPPGWDGYKFDSRDLCKGHYTFENSSVDTKKLTVKTDATGRGAIKLSSEFCKNPTAVTFDCESTVTDLNRQNWTSKLELVAHPADVYVGIDGRESFKAGENSYKNIVVTGIDGKILPGTKVELAFVEANSIEEQPAIIQHITIGDKPTRVSFKTKPSSTSLFVTATVKDSKGRLNQCCDFDKLPRPTDAAVVRQNFAREKIEIASDKPSYALGDRAKITIKSDIFPSYGFLILAKDKTLTTLPLTLEGPEKTIELLISEAYYPNVVITAFLANNRTNYSTGEHRIHVPPVTKRLSLRVEPNATVAAPGKEITLNVELKDQQDPVKNGQVAIAVVDEAVLALAEYKWPDPIKQFYRNSASAFYGVHTKTQDSGVWIMVANSRIIAGRIGESGGPEDSIAQAKPTLGFRKDLAALAFFKPVITTDSDGKAQVKFKLPDSVTRYRIMAIAAAGTDKFGSSESSLTTKLPLMLKPSPPRFLNFGDSCELPVIIQNQTDKPLKTEVALRSNNAEISEPGKSVTVPANDRIEVRFAVKAISNGQATFQCAAKADTVSDSTEFSLPILVPASKESVATYGVIDKGAIVQKLAAPSNVIESIGGLTISTSSSAMQSLGDSFNYLRNYQYDCSEQVSSRLIAMVSMQEALLAFGAVKPTETGAYKRHIEDDIAILEKRQNSAGGFGLWSAEETTKWPYVSIQVTQALLLAKAKLYPVNERALNRAVAHLKEIDKDIPAEYDKTAKLALLARALNIRHLAHDSDSATARELLLKAAGEKFDEQAIDKIKSAVPLEMAAWLLPVLKTNQSYSKEVDCLRTLINSQISETASTASTNDNGYGDCNYSLFYSPRRVDATVTNALIEDQPDNPLIPKLVKGLLAGRRNGIWQGTQENSYVLQALDKYFSTYEKQTPNFEGQTWLNDTLVANHKFAGRSLDTKSTTVPMEYLLSKGKATNDILINKEGTGRLYYRVALDYASKDFNLRTIEQGFTVSRTYEPVNAKSDVTKDEKGIWHFKAGSTIRVKVQFDAPGARYHVAMCDPLPAGTEAINKSLAGTQSLAPDSRITAASDSDSRETYSQHWSEHENLRDHQAEAFASLLNAGKYRYSYLIRATTPGHFTVPPTKVEEMYMSETFGRAHSDNVVVE
ncbi:MAG: alpha-2-macroglobulin family protein [Candidatus Obscuribacterales bacterium]